MPNTAQKLISSSALRIITLIVGIGISFYMMPFVIKHIGDRWYGLWVLTSSILGFYGLLDLGLSSATQRFIAYHIDDTSSGELIAFFNNSLLLYICIGFVALLVTALIIVVAPFFWHAKPSDISTFRSVIIIMGSTLAISFPFYVLNGIISSNYRYDLSSYIQIFKLLLRTALIVFAILKGYGILGMAIATICVDLTGNFLTLLVCRHLAPWLKINLRLISKTKMSALLNYSKHSFVIFIAERLKGGLDSLIVSSFLGIAIVTQYNIALQVSRYTSGTMNSLIGVTLPFFTRKFSSQDQSSLNWSFNLLTKIISVFSIAIGIPIIIYGPTFVNFWMGKGYQDSILPLQILVFGIMLSSIQGCATQIFYSHARHKILAYLDLGEGIFNLTLSILLVGKMGIAGVALGSAIPLITNRFIFFPIYIPKLLATPRTEYYKIIIKPLLIIAILLPTSLYLSACLPQPQNYVTLFIFSGSFFFTIVLLSSLSLLKASEISYIYRILTASRSARRQTQ